jgi:hypothetical protein
MMQEICREERRKSHGGFSCRRFTNTIFCGMLKSGCVGLVRPLLRRLRNGAGAKIRNKIHILSKFASFYAKRRTGVQNLARINTHDAAIYGDQEAVPGLYFILPSGGLL